MSDNSRLNIIVEGRSDADTVRKVFGHPLLDNVKFYAGQGKTSLATIARNLIFHEGSPVLLIMDSHSTDPHRVAEQISTVGLTLRAAVNPYSPDSVSTETLPVKVFAFVPEIEVIFFEVPQVLEKILGRKLTPDRVRRGLLEPKNTLAELLEETSPRIEVQTVLDQIDGESVSRLITGKQASALGEMIRSLVPEPVEAGT